MPELPPTIDQAIAYLEIGDMRALRELLADTPSADIADLLETVDHDLVRRVFNCVPIDARPDLLAEIEGSVSDDLLKSLTNDELSDLVEEMAPDDAADLLAELPDERSERVLDLMEDEESVKDVRELLSYPEDSAGGIMTTDVVAMRADQTVAAALDAIADMEATERFFIANIIDSAGVLIGTVDVWELLREKDRTRKIGELADTHFRAAIVSMDQEDVAHLLAKYDLDAIPVVDLQGRLVGRVTSDDVIDVLQEEASEDIFRLAGSNDEDLVATSVWKSCRIRLPWLLITLVGGMINAVIFNRYRAHLQSVSLLVLVSFVPTVLAMGGNTGIQSSILIVRSLAINGRPTRGVWKLIQHELATGAVMGLTCGLLIGTGAQLVIRSQYQQTGAITPLHLGAVIAVALFAAMTFAAMFGTLVPMALDRFKIDPAVAAGPFISIANDIMALLIYFAVTIMLLSSLVS